MNDRCKVVVTGKRCEQPAMYTFRLESCGACLAQGQNTCATHSACVDHMALIRSDTHVIDYPGTVFDRSSALPDSIVGTRNRATT